jgi:hypothetical protein
MNFCCGTWNSDISNFCLAKNLGMRQNNRRTTGNVFLVEQALPKHTLMGNLNFRLVRV